MSVAFEAVKILRAIVETDVFKFESRQVCGRFGKQVFIAVAGSLPEK
jgi:hypothetical protein